MSLFMTQSLNIKATDHTSIYQEMKFSIMVVLVALAMTNIVGASNYQRPDYKPEPNPGFPKKLRSVGQFTPQQPQQQYNNQPILDGFQQNRGNPQMTNYQMPPQNNNNNNNTNNRQFDRNAPQQQIGQKEKIAEQRYFRSYYLPFN